MKGHHRHLAAIHLPLCVILATALSGGCDSIQAIDFATFLRGLAREAAAALLL